MGKHRYNLNYKKHNSNKKNHQHSNENRCYSNVLLSMFEMYQPQGEDWMGFKLAKDNPYTFHHIRERRKGGKAELENGAILTEHGHQFLNMLDSHYKKAYEDYQHIFRQINKNRGPIDDDLLEDIYGMLLDIFYYNEYNMDDYELDYYEQFTDAKPKVKVIKK